MLIIENLESGLVHTYSDQHKYIRQLDSGNLYEDAIDLPGLHTYEETDIDIKD